MPPHLAAARDAARLAALASYDILDSVPETAFGDIVEMACDLCAAPIALISLLDATRQWFKAKAGFGPGETDLESSICAHAVAGGTMLIIPDLTQDARTSSNPLVTDAPGLRFYAGVPLQIPNGEILGTLCILDRLPRPDGLTPRQTANLQRLALQVMTLLELRRLAAQQGAALRQAQRFNENTLDRALDSEAQGDRLREAASRDLAAQQAGGTGLFQLDLASNEVEVSSEFCRLFDLPAAASYPRSVIETTIVPSDRNRFQASGYLEYRIRCPTGGTIRWIAQQADVVRDGAGSPVRFLGTIHDITDRKAAEERQAALLALGDSLRNATTVNQVIQIAVASLGDVLVADRAGYSSVNLETESFSVEAEWMAPGVDSLKGRHPIASFPETFACLKTGKILVDAGLAQEPARSADKAGYAALGVRAKLAAPLLQGSRLTGVLFLHMRTPRPWSDEEVAFVQAVADRTEAAIAKLVAEEERRLLGLELEHRLKNTLSMVQALVSQTLKGVAEREAVDALVDRLASLGKAHDILLQQSWNSARVAAIVTGVLCLHAEADRLIIEGPDLTFGSRGTLSLSMLLHELATNALKYGALSVAAGKVAIAWSVDHAGAEPIFCLRWTEIGGPAARPPTRSGFGSRLIAAGLLGTGRSSPRYEPEGFCCEFRASLSRLAES